MRRAAALILGGGPAGSAAAIALAQAGVRGTVIERTRETGDALCGGFLSWRTLRTLERLGIAAEALNREAITRVRLFGGGRVSEAPLPAPARAVSRRRLDTLLLDRALALGAGVERGIAIRRVEGNAAITGDGGALTGDAVLLATGKHDVRGLPRPSVATDPAIGLRIRLTRTPALDRLVGDAIELHLFHGGYAGLVRQEDGSANLCLAVRRSRLQAAGSPALLLRELARDHPALGERMESLTGAAAIDAVANVPYGWRATASVPGVYRIGDQAGVIPSLAGEGMGIALASGMAAAQAVLAGEPPARFQPAFARRLRRPVGVAALLWRVAERPGGARVMSLLAGSATLTDLAARLTRIGR
ncbi:Dehydrogenase (flavoprotein) [Sphingomonas guangdongensis]|uniref:Dehydrogenase (Flavoprotein) n=1 Tax=Sphingomonas guangdongensis TaxID=1141890 RepID=A0A285QFQ7_9SPHN|nr:FAD-dependent monooxygenase [Sphingomonas guangdongensis]SOB80358.1 Dehydrogenase (flavoprotein) [Sphingomonas guangdongensis]